MATSTETLSDTYERVFDIAKGPERILMPIDGYQDMPLVALEDAIEPLVTQLPRIKTYVTIAKLRCADNPSDELTVDQSASIMLYTMEWKPREQCLYFVLNATLRDIDRDRLKPWFSYLKLLLTALAELPSTSRTVYRGVNIDLSSEYRKDEDVTWWAFSSCTSSLDVLNKDQFLGKTGTRTMFAIECTTGKDISRYSYYRKENEILLLPARRFQVVAAFKPSTDLHIIQMTEIRSLMDPPSPITIDPPSPVDAATPETDPDSLKLILDQIINLLQLNLCDNKDEIIDDLLRHGQESLIRYSDWGIPDIYIHITDENANALLTQLKNYFHEQWKRQYHSCNPWFVQHLDTIHSTDSRTLYDNILLRTAKYGNRWMKNCSILSIVLQILFEGIDDRCLEETNLFNQLWFTITTNGIQSIIKYSQYIIEDVIHQQMNDNDSILFRSLYEYYRQELTPFLQQLNIEDRRNLYSFAVENLTRLGWKDGLKEIQSKILPNSYKNLSEKIEQYLQRQEKIFQRQESLVQNIRQEKTQSTVNFSDKQLKNEDVETISWHLLRNDTVSKLRSEEHYNSDYDSSSSYDLNW